MFHTGSHHLHFPFNKKVGGREMEAMTRTFHSSLCSDCFGQSCYLATRSCKWAGHEVLSWKNREETCGGWLALVVTGKDLSITGVLALQRTRVQEVHDIGISSSPLLLTSIQEVTQRGEPEGWGWRAGSGFHPIAGPPTSLSGCE